jgi:hypothetical protein
MGAIEGKLAKMGLRLPPVHPYPSANRIPCVQVGDILFFELWGPERGAHARSAIGVAELPRRSVLEIVGEFEMYR